MRELHKFIPNELVLVRDGKWSGQMDIIGDIRQILIQPPSEDIRYDFIIRDDSQMIVFKRSVLGSLSTENLHIPLFPGEKFLFIENSNYSGPFIIKIIYQS